MIAFRGDHTPLRGPAAGRRRRLRGAGEAEVGRGLAQVLGLDVGSTLALALSSGRELRLRVSGIVSAVEHDGRVAYVPARALLAAEPDAPGEARRRRRPRRQHARRWPPSCEALGSTVDHHRGRRRQRPGAGRRAAGAAADDRPGRRPRLPLHAGAGAGADRERAPLGDRACCAPAAPAAARSGRCWRARRCAVLVPAALIAVRAGAARCSARRSPTSPPGTPTLSLAAGVGRDRGAARRPAA